MCVVVVTFGEETEQHRGKFIDLQEAQEQRHLWPMLEGKEQTHGHRYKRAQ